MAIAEISIVPLGTATTSLSRYVADAVKLLQTSGLQYELTAMGTIIEGPLAEVMNVLQQMHESPFSKGASRVYTVIKLDDRRDAETGITHKVTSVEQKL
jgi:uncharacterized protein (TIGR00106 family)